MKKFILLTLTALGLVMVLAGCGNDDKIQRTWIKSESIQGNPKEEPVFIFKKGNEFEYKMSNATYAQGHYKIKDGNKVTMKSDIKSMNGNFDELSGKFNKDFSKFTLDNGEKFEPYKGNGDKE